MAEHPEPVGLLTRNLLEAELVKRLYLDPARHRPFYIQDWMSLVGRRGTKILRTQDWATERRPHDIREILVELEVGGAEVQDVVAR